MSARGLVYAVRGIDMDVRRREIHGVVGESGCGKTVTAKSIMRLYDENIMLSDGHIFFEGKDMFSLSEKEIQALRGSGISMIFQDPMTALNPLYTIGYQMEEMLTNKGVKKMETAARVMKLLEDVGVNPPESRKSQYPFEMSGGMLQRVMIAMAISCNPKLLIADEPTTSLDVTVQAQILNLLTRLRDERHMSILIITHNFGIVAEICDRVSVMYAGGIVESGDVREIFRDPRHPYTSDLIKSIPRSGTRGTLLATIPGTPPDLLREINGCAYAPRCRYSSSACAEAPPSPRAVSESHSYVCAREI
jgi:oligopeptide/dipeptide ABC transporter ATP-binding protein